MLKEKEWEAELLFQLKEQINLMKEEIGRKNNIIDDQMSIIKTLTQERNNAVSEMETRSFVESLNSTSYANERQLNNTTLNVHEDILQRNNLRNLENTDATHSNNLSPHDAHTTKTSDTKGIFYTTVDNCCNQTSQNNNWVTERTKTRRNKWCNDTSDNEVQLNNRFQNLSFVNNNSNDKMKSIPL